MRRALILPAVVVVLAGSFVAGYLLSRPDKATAPVAIPSLVDEVREALAGRYYRPVPAGVLHLDSVNAMLSALRDPYTAYLTPLSYRLVRHDTAASYSGIGVEVLPTERGLVVVTVPPGPAARAGVQRGDVIVQIGGRTVVGLGASKALARVVGSPSGRIRLVLDRQGAILRLSVSRGYVHAPTVQGRLVPYAGALWGYVRLATFRAGAAKLVARELQRLDREGAAGFVLDLRGDPGGLLSQAVAVSSLFLNGGVVVSLSGAHFVHEVFRASTGEATRLPVVVLVDRYTASSAEIVAAALSERGRALLVGERTFGKGVVQAVDPLDNGAALILTVARYFTPNGEDIEHVGVIPQLRVTDDPATRQDEALVAALHALARPPS
ncbi:MAG: S41 family peptidase [Gaiellaceae bacterium]